MMLQDNSYQAFFTFLKAGLWESDAQLLQCEGIDYSVISKIAEKQGVIGLIAAGLEHLQSVEVPKDMLLQFVGKTLRIEQRNKAMNAFIAGLVEKMNEAGIHMLMVKGQGIAQCYERPLWRPSGDVDFLMDDKNYNKADTFLTPNATYRKFGGRYSKEVGLGIKSWTVELHGSLRTSLSEKIDREVDAVLEDTLRNNRIRVWRNGETDVLLPAPDNDVFFVFTHFIKHFYKEGMSLRQLCDWCRLLWVYRESLNQKLLESRLSRAGLIGEWKAFAALAVNYLGIPVEAMPLYDKNDLWIKKSKQILNYIIKTETPNKFRDTLTIVKIFHGNTLRFLPSIFFHLNWWKIKERMSGK